jgi:hypothetical protein
MTMLRPSRVSTGDSVVHLCNRTDMGRGVAFSEGGGGSAIGVLEVENVGSRSCAVQGVPRVILRSAAGRRLQVSQMFERARGRRVVLRAGERAQSSFSWTNYCGKSGAASAELVWRGVSFRLRPAANGWMRRPRCDDPTARSTMRAGLLQRRG